MTYRAPVADAARELLDVDADDLVAIVLDGQAPWWRRRLSAAGLHRRLPARNAEQLFALLEVGAGGIEVAEVLAEVLGHTPGPAAEPLMRWLTVRTDLHRPTSRPELYLLRARAALGDPGAVRPLVRVAAEEHWRNRDGAIAVLDGLGTRTVLDALGASTPDELIDPSRWPDDDDVRLTGVRMLGADGDPTPALADPSRIVARAAYEALAARPHLPGGPVERMAAAIGPGRLWALAVLHAQGEDIRSLPAAVAASRVKLPTVPADVRSAIVRYWAPGRRLTDPRWLVEAGFTEAADLDMEDQLHRVAAALDRYGLRPGAPVPIGERMDQGEGTYHEIPTTAGSVDVSTLGPYFRTADSRTAAVLGVAGFRHITDRLAATVVDGLCVYFFGSTDPLPVGDLLFYWQD